jgi:hypothetical protein
MTRVGIKDVLLDAQTLRTAGSAPYGGADIGECLAAAARVRGYDLDSWYDAWESTAIAALTHAEGELAAGRTESARLAFWRSSSYFRRSGVMLMGHPAGSASGGQLHPADGRVPPWGGAAGGAARDRADPV